MISALRSFFIARGYDEVQTPILQVCPSMDAHIHSFKTSELGVGRIGCTDRYLHTSPELDMKKLLAQGMEKIFQICPVFRNAEGSPLHRSEFMMLEWYCVGANYTHLMDETQELVQALCHKSSIKELEHKGQKCNPFAAWQRLSVCDAFEQYAKIDLSKALGDRGTFAAMASSIGVRVIDSDQWDDIFHAIMAEKIEPFLGIEHPTILYDYPISMAALSRKKETDTRFAERFELYLCGVEIANAFSELTDPIEQRRRFNEEMELKKTLYGEDYPPDEVFFDALLTLPECAGIALGIDRLIMLMCKATDIRDIQWL